MVTWALPMLNVFDTTFRLMAKQLNQVHRLKADKPHCIFTLHAESSRPKESPVVFTNPWFFMGRNRFQMNGGIFELGEHSTEMLACNQY